jgi:hypothetical protein
MTRALVRLAALRDQLARDAATNATLLARRDRAIGAALPPGLNEHARLRRWLEQVRPAPESLAAPLETALRWSSLTLVVLGSIAGAVTASAVLAYEGTHPVNIGYALAWLVGLQLLLLLGLLIAALPHGLIRWLPPLRWLQELLTVLNVGRLHILFRRGLAQADSPYALSPGISKWLTLNWSQQFALAFNVAGLLTCVVLIVFSDLAFAWSTTLGIDAARFERLTQWLAAPWSGIWPDAVPSAELIELSRYFRLETGAPLDPTQAERLTAWWPFLIGCLLCYGCLPRVLTWIACRSVLERVIRRTMLDIPGAIELLDRMAAPVVETQAGRVAQPSPAPELRHASGASRSASVRAVHVIRWGDIALPDERLASHLQRAFGITARNVTAAGGAHSLREDAGIIEQASRLPSSVGVAVLVKAWEPPLLELTDFLVALRRSAPDRALLVVPVALDKSGEIAPVAALDADVWVTKLAALDDPKLLVMPLPPAAA